MGNAFRRDRGGRRNPQKHQVTGGQSTGHESPPPDLQKPDLVLGGHTRPDGHLGIRDGGAGMRCDEFTDNEQTDERPADQERPHEDKCLGRRGHVVPTEDDSGEKWVRACQATSSTRPSNARMAPAPMRYVSVGVSMAWSIHLRMSTIWFD